MKLAAVAAVAVAVVMKMKKKKMKEKKEERMLTMVEVQLQKKNMIHFFEDGDFHFYKIEFIFHLKNNKKKVAIRIKLWEEN